MLGCSLLGNHEFMRRCCREKVEGEQPRQSRAKAGGDSNIFNHAICGDTRAEPSAGWRRLRLRPHHVRVRQVHRGDLVGVLLALLDICVLRQGSRERSGLPRLQTLSRHKACKNTDTLTCDCRTAQREREADTKQALECVCRVAAHGVLPVEDIPVFAAVDVPADDGADALGRRCVRVGRPPPDVVGRDGGTAMIDGRLSEACEQAMSVAAGRCCDA